MHTSHAPCQNIIKLFLTRSMRIWHQWVSFRLGFCLSSSMSRFKVVDGPSLNEMYERQERKNARIKDSNLIYRF